MNYETQLNGWAVEMVIKAKDAGYALAEGLDSLLEDTKKLVEFAYNPRKAYEDHMAYFFELVRNSPPGEAKISALIRTLEHIQNDRYAQRIDVFESSENEVKQ